MPYELLTGSEGLERVETAWRALELRSRPTYFQTYDFVRIWHDTVGSQSGATALIVRYEEDGVTTALFPACVVRQGPIKLLTWLGGPLVLDYGDVLYDRASAGITVEEFVLNSLRQLRKRARSAFVYLTGVRDDAEARGVLGDALRIYKHDVAPYLPIEGEFDAYCATLSHKMHRRIESNLRRLSQMGEVAFVNYEPGDPRIEEAMRTLVDLKKERFNTIGARSELHDPRYERFRLEQACRDPHAMLAAITLDDAVIAASLQCLHNGRMYGLISAFDPAYSAGAPGKLLQRYIVQLCFEQGVNVLDFCLGDEDWKRQFTQLATPLTTFVSDDLAGRVLSGVAGARRRLLKRGGSAERS